MVYSAHPCLTVVRIYLLLALSLPIGGYRLETEKASSNIESQTFEDLPQLSRAKGKKLGSPKVILDASKIAKLGALRSIA